MLNRPTRQDLTKLRAIANYQFGSNAGRVLFPSDIAVTHSRKTGRIRLVYRGDDLIATLKPTTGLLALTPAGAKILLSKIKSPALRVVVRNEVSEFVRMGRNVFAKHVIEADPNLRPQDESIVVNERGELLAVGRAVLSGEEMLSFRSGVAVKVRKGHASST